MENYYLKTGSHIYFDCINKITLNQNTNYISNKTKKYSYDNFNLWIFTTQNCNCNCEYCKQNELRSNNTMTENTLKYVLDECVKIYNKHTVKKFEITLSGGEPFMVFDIFKDIIQYYRNKYSDVFNFALVTNGTIITDEIINWIKSSLNNKVCLSIDDIAFSKPINGVSSSNLQIDNILWLNKEGIRVSSISVFSKQNSMIPMAKFAIENFTHWRILLEKPYIHTKVRILNMAKPVLKFIFENDKHEKWFDFEGWNFWKKVREAGCVCGRTFLGILPDAETMPTNGEVPIKLGKFNSDLLSFINHPLNTMFRERYKPAICNDCELKGACDGTCKACHPFPKEMKERCDALKELFKYVETLQKI